ncbi:hypothetical protein NFI96_028558, partial [Prochilodus magdalenae]
MCVLPPVLPGVLLCGAPGSVFVSLGASNGQTVVERMNRFCSGVDPEVSTALVANFPTISTSTIQLLGNQSLGLTEGQISTASPTIISSTLPTLSTVTGWNQGQVNNVIQSITDAGFTINSGSSLVTLGTLIGGVPSAVISNIPSTELLAVSQNPTFITNILSAPVVLQQTYVQKIISVDQTKVLENVPDVLAAYIPPVLLVFFKLVDVSVINKKSWSPQQAAVLFRAASRATQDTEQLSESILQGFTCSAVQSLPRQKVTQLVKACRPGPGRSKVFLKESQLTCMYRYVKDDPSLSFTDLPSDMLLYYSYEKVKVNCRSYFSALGGADFSVLSSVLNRQSILFKNARACLGITGVGLTRDQVEVLGNMACTLDSTSIQNSDPLILEKLKNCGDLSDSQVTAVQTLLYSGSTPYGNPSAWNQQTLQQLGTLPLYLRQDFWSRFSSVRLGRVLGCQEKVYQVLPAVPQKKEGLRSQKWKLSRLFRAYSTVRVQTFCSVQQQDPLCMCDVTWVWTVTVLSDGAPGSCHRESGGPQLPNGHPAQAKAAVPIKRSSRGCSAAAGPPTSRAATVEDISRWNITTVDHPVLLDEPDNGDWSQSRSLCVVCDVLCVFPCGVCVWSKAVIMKYLGVPGNTLGTAELDAVGSNICSVDVGVLRAVTADSLRNASPLDISSCSIDQKAVLYGIAKSSFSTQRSDPTAYYQLISPYLGGAPLEDIQALSSLNISMDITTFLSLDPAVVTALSVSTVGGLMGASVADLQLFENTTVIRAWEAQQKQSELDTLNLGLQGGIPDVITSTSLPVTNPVTINTNNNVITTTTSTSTTASNTQNNLSTTAAVTNTVTTFISTASITAIAGLNSTDSTTSRISVTAIDSSATSTSSAHTTTVTRIPTINSTDLNVNTQPSFNTTTAGVSTSVPTTVSVNTTITPSSASITTVSPIFGSDNNTSNTTTTAASLNATAKPTASANTTISTAGVNTTTLSSITASDNNTSIKVTAASLDTTANTTASADTTISTAGVNTTSTIRAPTADLNITPATAVTANTTIISTGINTTTLPSPINGNVNDTSINPTTASLNNPATTTASANNSTIITVGVNATIITAGVNTTIITAGVKTTAVTEGVNTTTLSPIYGNVNNTSINPTTDIHITAASTASANNTINTAGVHTTSLTGGVNTTIITAGINITTLSPINGNVSDSSINATTASHITTSTINTTIITAGTNTSSITAGVNTTHITEGVTTASLNITTAATASVNTTSITASVNTTIIMAATNTSSITAGVNTSSITGGVTTSSITGVNTTSITAGINTSSITGVNTTSITGGNTTSITAGINTSSITGGVTASSITGGVTTSSITGVNTTSITAGINTSSITGGVTTSSITGVNTTSITGVNTTSITAGINTSSITGVNTTSTTAGINTSSITGGVTASSITGVNTTSITGGVTASSITGVNTTSITAGINTSSITGGVTASSITGVNTTSITGVNTTSITGVNTTSITAGINTSSIAVGVTASSITGVNTTSITGVNTTSITAGINTSSITGGVTASSITGVNTTSITGVNTTSTTAGLNTSSITGGVTASSITGVNTTSITGVNTTSTTAGLNTSSITGGVTASSITGVNTTSITGVNTTSTTAGLNTSSITGGVTASSITGVNTTSITGVNTTSITGVNTTSTTGGNTTSITGVNTTSITGGNTTSITGGVTASSITGVNTTSITGVNTTSTTAGLNTSSITGGVTTASLNISTVTTASVNTTSITAGVNTTITMAGTNTTSITAGVNTSSITGGISTTSITGGVTTASLNITPTTTPSVSTTIITAGINTSSITGGVNTTSITAGINTSSITGGVNTTSITGGVNTTSITGGITTASINITPTTTPSVSTTIITAGLNTTTVNGNVSNTVPLTITPTSTSTTITDSTTTAPKDTCQGVDSRLLETQLSSGSLSAVLCNFSIPDYACSSVAVLSSDDLASLLACKLPSSVAYSKEIWTLFFQRFSVAVDEALDKYSSMTLNLTLRDPYVLDAIGEVKVSNFSEAQLTDGAFISEWFQTRLRPFLPSVSADFLSILSSKDFSCQTYQVVVEAFSMQETHMEKSQKVSVITDFIYPFLSRHDPSDPGCISGTSGSSEWLAKNFGNFSTFATLEQLQGLNPRLSRFESLDLLSPSQAAELTLTSGALNSTSQMELVFARLEKGDAFRNVEEFFTALTDQEVGEMVPAVRDVVMNRTFQIISMEFPQFDTSDWMDWFEIKLSPVLPSLTAEMLAVAVYNTSCTNYHVIVEALSVSAKMPEMRNQELVAVLVAHLKQSSQPNNPPACRVNNQTDADWLTANLGRFSSSVSFSQLTQFNISGVAVLDYLTGEQKAQLILQPGSGALVNESVVREVFSSVVQSSDQKQLENFLIAFSQSTVQ